jgi:hypothetical protein
MFEIANHAAVIMRAVYRPIPTAAEINECHVETNPDIALCQAPTTTSLNATMTRIATPTTLLAPATKTLVTKRDANIKPITAIRVTATIRVLNQTDDPVMPVVTSR